MKSLFTIVSLFIAQLAFSQSIVSVTPNAVMPGTVTGTISFEGNLTFWNTGAGLYQIVLAGPNDTIWPASQNIIDDTHAEATYLIPTSADTGCYDVRAYDIIADTVWFFCGMTVSNTAGIDDISLSTGLEVFPNPFSAEVNIQGSDMKVGDNLSIHIYDLQGKLIRTLAKDMIINSTDFLLEWNGRSDQGDEVDSGLYYLSISRNGQLSTHQMVKQ